MWLRTAADGDTGSRLRVAATYRAILLTLTPLALVYRLATAVAVSVPEPLPRAVMLVLLAVASAFRGEWMRRESGLRIAWAWAPAVLVVLAFAASTQLPVLHPVATLVRRLRVVGFAAVCLLGLAVVSPLPTCSWSTRRWRWRRG